MPYLPALPPAPPPLVRLVQADPQAPAENPPPERARDLQAQGAGQAQDLSAGIDNTALQPREEGVPVGGALKPGEEVFLDADTQQYDQINRVFTARGNVKMRLREVLLSADQMQVNLDTRLAVAEGNVKLVQGEQRIAGTRMEYNFARKEGVLLNATGRIDTKAESKVRINTPLAADLTGASELPPPPKPRGGILRFEAKRIVFNAEGWRAEDLRVTPDQFDPPELELVSARATLREIGPGSNRLMIDSGTLFFDQNFAMPFPAIESVIDNEKRKPPYEVGSDFLDKGGVYYQQNLYVEFAKNITFQISPQLYIQQALSSNSFLDPKNFGLQNKLSVEYDNGQLTRLFSEINGLVLDDLENRVRARLEHIVPVGDHTLTFSYAYRERFFNYLLGFQTAQSNLGITLDSSLITLGSSGVRLSYQANAALISANSDQPQLDRQPDLSRFRVAGSLSKTITLLQAEFLPLSRETLRFTQVPVTPGLFLDVGTTLVQSWYSSGDSQGYLGGRVSLFGILGRFSRDFLDYTALNLSYNNGFVNGESPFLFDRVASREQVFAGIIQQIYGPLRFGVQTGIDLTFGRAVDTFYTVSLDRRTYSLSITYNPVRQTGGFQLRVDDFNWGTNAYGRPDQVTDVVGGVERFNRNGPGSP
ncbi:MAG: DUF3769 domain-containing protein [Aphanocapsa lilacina HA4352-LM1]|jgi:hypothetical protein|nr:DUF3769 domain-containing protein [Aphanocapsa lilacina HA4352-LM1]